MDIKRADAVSKQLKCAGYAIDLDQMDAILREEQRGDMVLRVTDLAISGKDVIDFMGIEPGPMVGMVLSRLLAAVVDNEVENTREALFDELMIQAQELD
jgi:tRNA nucleotidyltransferase (CCA-adding enzyme)